MSTEHRESDLIRSWLDEYYEARGWDKNSGYPTRQKLEQLGLQEVVYELESLSRLAW